MEPGGGGEAARLRVELDAVCAQRDLLLCEVASLRRELELSELKHLHDDSSCKASEEGGGALHGLYRLGAGTLAHHHHAAPADSERGYMDAGRYVAHASLSGLNHSNSSCSSSSAASCAPPAPLPAPPLYLPGAPEHFAMRAQAPQAHHSSSRYEMSQDLLDKQTEILERRYGGLRARRAAITLQRAFRRRQLLRKFSAITAMAKMADSAARRAHDDYTNHNGEDCGHQSARVAERAPGLSRAVRSVSLRERGAPDIDMVSDANHANDIEALAARVRHEARQLTLLGEQRARRDTDSGVCSCSVNGSATNISTCSSHQDSPHSRHHLNNSGPIYSNLVSNGGKPFSSPQCQQAAATAAAASAAARRPPPEVPKRTSSITLGNAESPVSLRRGECGGCGGAGGQDAHAQYARLYAQRAAPVPQQEQHYPQHQRTPSATALYDNTNERYEVWKRQTDTPPYCELAPACCAHQHPRRQDISPQALKLSETVRKRQYRVGLNLFNKKPERGVAYLIARGFLENSPRGVARFLITRKGLSKQMIGEYLGNLQSTFNMAVLECFVNELDLSGMAVDVALRRYQAHFRLPGEAQKIERLVEAFARRYCACNTDLLQRLRTRDTIFVLAFAIIMLNTDLHTPNLKPEARMSLDDFVRNLRGVDDCGDIDRETLAGIYERVKCAEFRPGSDHVTQVMKVQATIAGKKPQLALPHRRLVCYCRLYEIADINRKERPGVHQREVFLFNDLLVITKIFSKKKSSVTYTFRQSFPLCGITVNLFSVAHYPFGIGLSRRVDGRRLATFNARNEHDRCKFAEDLRESIAEMDEMESLRIEAELSRSKARAPNTRNGMENRDSGVADVEIDQQQCSIEHLHHMHGAVPPPPACPAPPAPRHHPPPPATNIKRNVLSNSLVDINDPVGMARLQRRGSLGSLDSGMSVTCQQSCRTHPSPPRVQSAEPRRPLLSGIFPMRQRKLSASTPEKGTGKSTEV